MDPVSMTASIIAILQLTTALTSYINDVRHANREQEKVAIEASNLSALLTRLRFRVERAQSDDPWFNQVYKMLEIHDGPLDQFKNILEKMMEHIPTSNKRTRIMSALTWKFIKSDVDDALKRMESLKSLITLELSQATSDNVETIKVRTQRLAKHADQESLNRLSRWLGLPDPSTNFNAALEKRHPGTGLWLINGKQFNGWKGSASSLMWLYGNAGCGKTVLSAASLQEINHLKNAQPDTVAIYYYFDFNDIEKQSSQKAIRSLLFQIILQQQDRLHVLEDLYQRCGRGQQQPAEDVIRSLLNDAVSRTGHKYIVVDALDECTDCEKFLAVIHELVTSRQDGLRIMITSRRSIERDIEDQLGSVTEYDINIQSTIVDEDIRLYLRDLLVTDSKLNKWNESTKENIIKVMMEKANGMFRWVYCQLQSLRRCLKQSALQEALSTLPKTLYETYDRTLQGIESDGHLEDAITALRWLCFSLRPVYLSEIVEALAIMNGENGGFCPGERLRDPADIIEICSSLIDYSDVDEDDLVNYCGIDEEACVFDDIACKTRIRLAHFSVKEYLLSGRSIFKSKFQRHTCHMAIAEGCLHYVLQLYKSLPLTKDVVVQHPLSRYAAEYWWQHAQAFDGTLSPTLIRLIENLLMNKDAGVLPWIQLYNIDSPREGIDLSRATETMAQPLYYAASIGLTQIVEEMMPQVNNVNAKSGYYDNVLQAASVHGHTKMVQILLNAGANINAKGRFSNALEAASEGGHEKTVQILLDTGADVHPGGGYSPALMAALKGGYDEVVQMLISAGADVNGEGYWGNVLSEVSGRGLERMVQTLLDAGANVNAGRESQNALTRASGMGHVGVVQILLDAGANIMDEIALIKASRRGHKNVVRLLVDAGTGTYTEKMYNNALFAAADERDYGVVSVLLDAKADAGFGIPEVVEDWIPLWSSRHQR